MVFGLQMRIEEVTEVPFQLGEVALEVFVEGSVGHGDEGRGTLRFEQ